MNRIVRRTLGDPVTKEMREELARIAAMPDSAIRTDLIPETTPEQFAKMRRRRALQQTERRELQKTA